MSLCTDMTYGDSKLLYQATCGTVQCPHFPVWIVSLSDARILYTNIHHKGIKPRIYCAGAVGRTCMKILSSSVIHGFFRTRPPSPTGILIPAAEVTVFRCDYSVCLSCTLGWASFFHPYVFKIASDFSTAFPFAKYNRVTKLGELYAVLASVRWQSSKQLRSLDGHEPLLL